MAKAQYDREDILCKAIELFWSHGFSGSSMQQVVEATGLKPGSIYYSFGNKQALFKEALEHYARLGLEKIRKTLDEAPSIGEGICRHLERFVQEAASEGYRSCFLVKTQLELGNEDQELNDTAAAKLDEIEGLFRSYLEREYDPELSRDRAASIMLHIFGLRVYGYRQAPAEQMRKALRQGLPWLPWPEVS